MQGSVSNSKSSLAKLAFRFVVVIGIVNFFADFSYEGARSINGAFLASLGASSIAVGLTAGFGELIGFGLRSLSGFVADKSHRYWLFAVVGYLINMGAVPAMALAGNWPVAAMLIVAERTGRAIRKPSVETMLSYSAGELGSGWVFGLNEVLDQFGGTLGPLVVACGFFVRGWGEGGVIGLKCVSGSVGSGAGPLVGRMGIIDAREVYRRVCNSPRLCRSLPDHRSDREISIPDTARVRQARGGQFSNEGLSAKLLAFCRGRGAHCCGVLRFFAHRLSLPEDRIHTIRMDPHSLRHRDGHRRSERLAPGQAHGQTWHPRARHHGSLGRALRAVCIPGRILDGRYWYGSMGGWNGSAGFPPEGVSEWDSSEG